MLKLYEKLAAALSFRYIAVTLKAIGLAAQIEEGEYDLDSSLPLIIST
jgi:hypothetical protein